MRAVKDTENLHGIVVDPVCGDIWGALNDEFASSGDPAWATDFREALQTCGGIPDAVVDSDGSAGIVCVDVFVDIFAVRECERQP